MIDRFRHIVFLLPAFIALLSASSLQAQTNQYWQGGEGVITNPNYTDGALTNLTAASSDVAFIGAGGSATLSDGQTAEFHRIRIGHNETDSGKQGQGTVTVSNGATLRATGGASGVNNAGLIVGSVQAGTLVIDGPGSQVISNRLIVVGIAPGQPNRRGTIRVTNGGSLIASDGNVVLGTIPGTAANPGMQGHIVIENGYMGVLGAGADFNIGLRNATSSFTLNSGVVEVADAVDVATPDSGTGNQSSFTMTGGSFTNLGHFFLGRGASTNATLNLSGGTLSVGNRLLVGSGTATGVTVNHTGGTLAASVDIRIGDSGTADSTYKLSGTGTLNSNAGGIIGRQGTGRFVQTGGEANFMDLLQLGSREVGAEATSGLYKISGGVLKAGAMIGTNALSIAPNGTGEFRVVGDDSAIDVYGNLVVNKNANGVGTLAFELESGDLLSTINVTNTAIFQSGSKLVFDVTNAVPTQTTYDLLTATSIVDEGLTFSGPAGWNYQIVSGGAGQILQAFGPLLAIENADFNGDGTVDGNDFLAWQRGFSAGSPATLANGDANGDGAVNAADLNIWKTKFGGGVAAPATAAVPEPASWGMALVIACAMTRFRKKS